MRGAKDKNWLGGVCQMMTLDHRGEGGGGLSGAGQNMITRYLEAYDFSDSWYGFGYLFI